MTFDFWIPIFDLVDHCAQTAAAKFFCHRFGDLQSMYSEFLRLLMLQNLIRGTLKLPNSRERLLIPAGVSVKIRKNIAVMKIRGHHIQSLKSRTGSKEIRERILETVMKLKEESKNQFFVTLCALHDEVDHYGATQPVTAPLTTTVATAMEVTNMKMENLEKSKPERFNFTNFPIPWNFNLNPISQNPISQNPIFSETQMPPLSDGDSSSFYQSSCCSSSLPSEKSVGSLSENAFVDRELDDSWSKVSVNPPDFMVPVSDNASICSDALFRYHSSTFRNSLSQSARYRPY